MDLERDCLVELEDGAAVESGEALPVQLEVNDHDGARRLAVKLLPGLAVSGNLADLRVPEDRGVESGGLFGLAVEPQAGGDPLDDLHGCFSLLCRVHMVICTAVG